jgi:hypothetical protein
MHQMIRAAVAAIFAAALASFPTGAGAQIATKQIRLTEKHVEGFIAAQKDLSAVVEKMHAAAAQAKFQAELEAVTRKHGFKNFSEYEDVAANISMLMAAIDPQTKAFTDPPAAIRKEIEDVSADTGLPEEEKKQLLQELKEALKAAQPVQFPSNVELVKRYYEKIDAALG